MVSLWVATSCRVMAERTAVVVLCLGGGGGDEGKSVVLGCFKQSSVAVPLAWGGETSG
jgi:hypothetical protein